MHIVGKDTCQIIRLKFQTNEIGIVFRFTDSAAKILNLLRNAKERLHMVAYFMSHHIGHGEISRCAEPLTQLLVEFKIDIHFLIRRAVERTGG